MSWRPHASLNSVLIPLEPIWSQAHRAPKTLNRDTSYKTFLINQRRTGLIAYVKAQRYSSLKWMPVKIKHTISSYIFYTVVKTVPCHVYIWYIFSLSTAHFQQLIIAGYTDTHAYLYGTRLACSLWNCISMIYVYILFFLDKSQMYWFRHNNTSPCQCNVFLMNQN